MTPQSIKKALYIPGIGVIAYMLFTLYFFEFGPRDWNPMNKGRLYFYLICYLLAFTFGYFINLKLTNYSKIIEYSSARMKINNRNILLFLKFAIWVDLCFTFLNAIQYANIGSFNPMELVRGVISSLNNPVSAYYAKWEGELGTSLLTWVTILISPILLSARVLSVLYFKQLKKYQKLLVVFSIGFEICRWIAISTNKGIFDIVILFLTAFVVKWVYDRAQNVKVDWRKLLLIICCVGLALFYFGFVMTTRSTNTKSGVYGEFDSLPWNLVPGFMRPMVYSLNSYLCQGYYGLSLCMSLDWIPTGGLGFSGWINRMFKTFLGSDVSNLTFQSRASVYGWHPSGRWHSMYSWFANDIHYLGVIILMFFMGVMFAALIKETVFEKKAVSAVLLYLFFIEIVYISANNQVFMVSNTVVAFIVLFFIWVFGKIMEKRKIRLKQLKWK